jgi:hypothetical protein
MWDELLVRAKLADLYRDLAIVSPDALPPGFRGGRLPAALPAAAGRTLRLSTTIVESPRLDARRILGRWLMERRSAARYSRGA